MIFGLKPATFKRSLLITAIETIDLSYWAYLGVKYGWFAPQTLIVLFIGLEIEHIVALIAGRIEGQP